MKELGSHNIALESDRVPHGDCDIHVRFDVVLLLFRLVAFLILPFLASLIPLPYTSSILYLVVVNFTVLVQDGKTSSRCRFLNGSGDESPQRSATGSVCTASPNPPLTTSKYAARQKVNRYEQTIP